MKNLLKGLIIASAVFISSCSTKNNKEIELYPFEVGNVYQYVDKDGKIVINPQFSQATVFREGLALVKASDNPLWGFIDTEGKYVIAAKYKEATVFSEGIAWVVTENSAPTAIDKKGETLFTLAEAAQTRIFADDLAAFSKADEDSKEKWGFVNNKGAIVINDQFDNVGDFSENLAAVCNSDGKWGYINKEGKIVINYQFSQARKFVNGKAIVGLESKFGLIDKEGKYVINPQFDNILPDGDLIAISQGGKVGWADLEGKIVINPQFKNSYPFGNSKLAAVLTDSNWGFINKDGKFDVNPQFDFALPFVNGIAIVQSAKKLGLINEEGKYLVNPQFEGVSDDLVIYVNDGGTRYNTVRTTYFDMGNLATRINFESPEGLTFEAPISTILTKFSKTETDIYNSTRNILIANEKITSEIMLNFGIMGNPYEAVQVQVGSGYDLYYDTQYKYNPNSKPLGFYYDLPLSGKANGRGPAIKAAIEKSLVGYTRNPASDDWTSLYNNNRQTIKIEAGSNKVSITIVPIGSAYNLSVSSVDSTAVDSGSYDGH